MTRGPFPINEAPKDAPFLVWHAGEWRIVVLYVGVLGDDIVRCVFTNQIWGATCWWPLPPKQSTNEGRMT